MKNNYIKMGEEKARRTPRTYSNHPRQLLIMKLLPCHSGTFEVFDFVDENGKSERFARYHYPNGYTWYKFNFFTETYQSLENETQLGFDHHKLEEQFQKYRQSIENS